MRRSSAETAKPDPAKAARPPTVFSTAIDGSFQADASVRGALTENLKPLRVRTEAIDARLQLAFKNFNAQNLIGDERGGRRYVAPGSNPTSALDEVITQRVKEIRSAGERRSLTLRDTSELRSLVRQVDNGRSVVDLGELIEYIDRKSRVSTLVAEPQLAPLAAEIEAERLLADAERSRRHGEWSRPGAKRIDGARGARRRCDGHGRRRRADGTR